VCTIIFVMKDCVPPCAGWELTQQTHTGQYVSVPEECGNMCGPLSVCLTPITHCHKTKGSGFSVANQEGQVKVTNYSQPTCVRTHH
jgi:hypothetical protein